MIGGWEIPALVVGAIVLFGADKIPQLARGLGQAKKEFVTGQTEAEQTQSPSEKQPETKQP